MSVFAIKSAARFQGVTKDRRAQRSSLVALWLLFVSFLVLAMVVVGGATRLTGSGLSITQWKPITGAIPPLSHEAWLRTFALYQATPQYRLVNQGMSLANFQFIFWWEWAHRLLGRLLGVVFFLPFLAFLALGRLPRRLIGRCIVLFALGGLQGAVGWWMVKSGLEARISVAPERLAIHLGLALLLFMALIWTALEAWKGPPAPAGQGRRSGWVVAATLFAAGVFLQCLLGALVAGNKAGLIDNDWPWMGGRFIPIDYWQDGMWATFAHGLSAVQFNHRLWAYGLFVAASALVIGALVRKSTPPAIRRLSFLIATIVVTQIALGVATLVWGVPLPLAMAHQTTAALLLACATAFAWQAQRI